MIRARVEEALAERGQNRLMQQLRKCALEYGCRAAQNFFLHRHEAPLPVSVACNARCVGCISLQPDGTFKAAHDRLSVAPSPDEVAEVALLHIGRVRRAVVSFGQGCEGEPLLMGDLLVRSVRQIRRETRRGTINLNTNASLPDVVEDLVAVGLDSMRVSLNSARQEVYSAYYRPSGYSFADIVDSMHRLSSRGRFVSLNLLYFPGVTDTEAEIDALSRLVERAGVSMIQLRNMNLDPEIYARHLPSGVFSSGMGLDAFTYNLKLRCPWVRFGYFNPPKEAFQSWDSPGVRY